VGVKVGVGVGVNVGVDVGVSVGVGVKVGVDVGVGVAVGIGVPVGVDVGRIFNVNSLPLPPPQPSVSTSSANTAKIVILYETFMTELISPSPNNLSLLYADFAYTTLALLFYPVQVPESSCTPLLYVFSPSCEWPAARSSGHPSSAVPISAA
jgi:hypothetical protein